MGTQRVDLGAIINADRAIYTLQTRWHRDNMTITFLYSNFTFIVHSFAFQFSRLLTYRPFLKDPMDADSQHQKASVNKIPRQARVPKQYSFIFLNIEITLQNNSEMLSQKFIFTYIFKG